jgi:hypothetical protein
MCGRKAGTKNTVLHIWSREEKEYLKQITPGHHHNEIQEMMNKKFELEFTLGQIKGAINRYGLNTGLTGYFEKGSIPYNKNKKGSCAAGSEKGWFKKGRTPANHKPIGSERINVDGYIEIKVSEPNKWRLKHQVIWEEHNGKIPKGYAVIFGDTNSLNLAINNLILVSRHQLLIMNKNNLIQNDADLTRTGVIIADIYKKISEKKAK